MLSADEVEDERGPAGSSGSRSSDEGDRHGRRDAGARGRAVLHHQGRGQGHRARPVDGAGHGRAVRRAVPARKRGRQGHARRSLAAGDRATRPVAGAPRRRPSAAAGRPLRILAVDDDPIVLLNTADRARRHRPPGDPGAFGPAALVQLAEHAGRPAADRLRDARDDRGRARRAGARRRSPISRRSSSRAMPSCPRARRSRCRGWPSRSATPIWPSIATVAGKRRRIRAHGPPRSGSPGGVPARGLSPPAVVQNGTGLPRARNNRLTFARFHRHLAAIEAHGSVNWR